jgi:hypothetical protein
MKRVTGTGQRVGSCDFASGMEQDYKTEAHWIAVFYSYRTYVAVVAQVALRNGELR